MRFLTAWRIRHLQQRNLVVRPARTALTLIGKPKPDPLSESAWDRSCGPGNAEAVRPERPGGTNFPSAIASCVPCRSEGLGSRAAVSVDEQLSSTVIDMHLQVAETALLAVRVTGHDEVIFIQLSANPARARRVYVTVHAGIT